MRLRTRPAATVAAALAALAAPALAGCGEPSDEEQVRTTLKRFTVASARQDVETICDELLARELIEKLRSVALPCPVALGQGLSDVEAPRLAVGEVKVEGDRALAEVRSTAAGQPTSQDIVRLVREEGGWRLASLSGPQPPTPENELPIPLDEQAHG